MITVTALKWAPPFARGLVRDLRVRWALEEAGLAYRSRLLEDKTEPEYRAKQPFGQVPVYEDDKVSLFESGAIVLYVGQESETLLPADPAERARATTWVFAALNSVEPAVQQLAEIDLFYPDEDWAKQRRPGAEAAVKTRLTELAEWLNGKDYLEGRFTAGDLMMASVLRILRHTDLVSETPALSAYLARCEARPAFERALAAQMGDFESD